MKPSPLASIIINNHNYGRFLAEAIDSALTQSYPHTEVIVVDDGSTDESRSVITRYRSRITPVLKENGGQTSALNAGFEVSRGEVVCFLDADDLLAPRVIHQVVDLLDGPDTAKVHWPLWVIDHQGRRTGDRKPAGAVPEGDLREAVVRDGPDSPSWPPTSGNAWSRRFLEAVFPLPEMEGELAVGSASADAYLSMLAPLFGHVQRISEPQGCYRLHGQNDHSGMEFDRKLRRDLKLFDYRSRVLSAYCCRMGIKAHPETWPRKSWFHRLHRAMQEIGNLITPGAPFILVDDGHWGLQPTQLRRPIPFLEQEGQYWGNPADDETAIREMERLRHGGAKFIVFAWPSFWWLDHYAGFADYLRSHFRCVHEDDCLIVFDLRAGRPMIASPDKDVDADHCRD